VSTTPAVASAAAGAATRRTTAADVLSAPSKRISTSATQPIRNASA
jgi:hypothetical protein